MFLLTDAQVPEESFLVLINDLLASGEIPGLYADDEVENIISGIRNEVKGAGLQDTRDNCWRFFIERVRRNLKVQATILCIYKDSVFHSFCCRQMILVFAATYLVDAVMGLQMINMRGYLDINVFMPAFFSVSVSFWEC